MLNTLHPLRMLQNLHLAKKMEVRRGLVTQLEEAKWASELGDLASPYVASPLTVLPASGGPGMLCAWRCANKPPWDPNPWYISSQACSLCSCPQEVAKEFLNVPMSFCPLLTMLAWSAFCGHPCSDALWLILPVLLSPCQHAVLKEDRRNALSSLDFCSIAKSFTPSKLCSSTIWSLLWSLRTTKSSKG